MFMNVSNNGSSGDFPNPTSTSSDFPLQSLHLANNNFFGVFPSVIEKCRMLITLDIGNNKFFGDIPSWIGSSVPLLRILGLRSNNFSGKIPSYLSQLSQLQLLDMANNRFTGFIPRTFGNLSSMIQPKTKSGIESFQTKLVEVHQVSMSPLRTKRSKPNNQSPLDQYRDRVSIFWKGRPQTFQKTIEFLAGIDLSSNSLNEDIPEELTYLQGLRFLNLSRNDLSGSIPEETGSLKLLESLDFSWNKLSGVIPPSMSDLSSLSALNLSNNGLWGEIPTGSQLQTLVDPSIYSNNSGLCGFPLSIACSSGSSSAHTLDERTEEHKEDVWLCYSVILGIVFGFWVWFGALFFLEPWRFLFFHVVDRVGCKIMQNMLTH